MDSLCVRVDELVKDLRPPKAAALRAVLDKFINTNRNAVHAIKAAFWALDSYFAERLALTWLVYNVTHRQLVIAVGDH
jgi:hypothetical protein